MTKAAKEEITRAIREKRRQLQNIREEVEDLLDHLDVLEARARDEGKPRLTHSQVKKRYGVK
jgi:NTP pyrophosphatase (non-canonical NTP hydrolase)